MPAQMKLVKKYNEPINLNDYDASTLWKLKREIEDELRKRSLAEIRELEDRANEIRAMVGYRQRPRLRKERLVNA